MSDQNPGGPYQAPPPGHQPPPPPSGQGPYGQQPPGQAPYGHQPPGQAPYGQHPPHAAPPPPHSQVGQPADLMTRFLARLIDNIIIGIAYSIVSGIVTAMAISSAMSGAGFGMFATGWVGIVLSLLIAAMALGYFALMESSRGQTLGKMAMKIKTFGPGGANPTMSEAVKRNLWTALPVLGVIPLVGGAIGSLLSLAVIIYIAVTINNNTATRQGWHDTFAGGTTVIKVG